MWWSPELNSPIPVHFTTDSQDNVYSSPVLLDHDQFDLHGPNIPGSCNTVLCGIRFSGAVSSCPPVSPGTLDALRPGGYLSVSYLFALYTVHGVPMLVYWSGLPFLPVDQVLSEHFTMTGPSWVALHGVAHIFIVLCKPLHHGKGNIFSWIPLLLLSNNTFVSKTF